jgi:hypothetical protein
MLSFAGVLALAMEATPVRADPDESPLPPSFERTGAARVLFEEGLAHADHGRWAEAADRFERAQALRASPEIAYNLSTALVRQGRLLRGSELLRQIVADEKAAPAVRQAAERRLAQLSRRLAHLVVEPPLGGEEVFLDGRRLEPALLGLALPVDPGPHTVELRKGTATLFTRGLTFSEGQRRTVGMDRLWPSPAAAQFSPATSRRRWAWVVLGAVALGTTAAVVAARDP